MALAIDLDDPKKVWHPGDAVSGKVVLKPWKHLHVERVEAILGGRIEARSRKAGPQVTADDTQARLFRRKVTLFTGPYTLAAAQEWPFTLHFPRDCRSATRGKFVPGQPPLGGEAWPLPPTTVSGNADYSNTTNEHISVQYWLRAEVVLKGLHANFEKYVPLKVMPYRDGAMQHPIPTHVEVYLQRFTRSPHLDPAIGDRNLNLKEKLKVTFSSPNDIPGCHYTIIAEFPDQGILGEPPPISLSVGPPKPKYGETAESIENASSMANLPPVELKWFTLHVVRIAGYRAAQAKGRSVDEVELTSRNDESQIARWSGSALLNGTLNIQRLYQHEPTDWERVVPDFAVFKHYECHILKLKIGIKVARQSYEVQILSPAFKVLSPYYQTPGVSNDPGTADAMEGDHELPPYER